MSGKLFGSKVFKQKKFYSTSKLNVALKFEESMKKNNKFNSLQKKYKNAVVACYCGSYLSELPMIVLGPSPSVWIPSVLLNFGISAQNPFMRGLKIEKYSDQSHWDDPGEQEAMKKLIQTLDDDSGSDHSGGVVFETLWSTLANDAFVQGAVDTQKEVHIATNGTELKDIPQNILFDQANNRPKVLGRELALAGLSKYKVVNHDYKNLGVILDGSNTKEFDLNEFDYIISQVKTENDYSSLMKDLFK